MGNRFRYIDEEIKEGKTAKQVLNEMAKEANVDITVVGQHGRKGPKADPTVMGSAVQYLSVQSAGPVMIIKDHKTRKDRPNGYTLAACVDGSAKSHKSLQLLTRMKSAEDKIYIIIAEQEHVNAEEVSEKIKTELQSYGCNPDSATIQILKH